MNPFAFLRKKAGFSQRKFCEEFSFAKQTIVGIEKGFYPSLSDRMLDAVLAACERAGVDAAGELADVYGTPYLDRAYEAWRLKDRDGALLHTWKPNPYELSERRSPMAEFVMETVGSVQGFAKLLKVPPATLQRYMDGKQAMMPTSIFTALEAVSYPHLRELQASQREWVKAYCE